MKEYRYTGLRQLGNIWLMIGGIMAALFVLVWIGALLYGATQSGGDVSGLLCFVPWGLFVGSGVVTGLLNQYPTVWITDDHLVISAFIFWRVRIPWSDVLGIRDVRRWPGRYLLVVARRITPFHRLFGWQYAWTFRPAFVIRTDIQGYEELRQEIIDRADTAHGWS